MALIEGEGDERGRNYAKSATSKTTTRGLKRVLRVVRGREMQEFLCGVRSGACEHHSKENWNTGASG